MNTIKAINSIPCLDDERIERFWSFVKKGTKSECWLWMGCRSKSGYGNFKINGKSFYAHRIAFAITYGDSPAYLICHECDNPQCVNPAHLFDQTPKENMHDSIIRNRRKPKSEFPLYLHRTGQWAKKVRGRTHYFGTDRDAAIDLWLRQRDELLAGRVPSPSVAGLELRALVNRFLAAKQSLVETGELSQRTWADYYRTADAVLEVFGKGRQVDTLTPDDFQRLRSQLARERSHVALGNMIQRVRTIFKFAWDNGLLEKPVQFGTVFRKPPARTIRAARHKAESRMIEADDLRRIIEAARQPLRAMILLGVNCGFGNTDVSNLPMSALDLAGGWVSFPRPKTATPRRCKLWPETVAALEEAIALRRRPKMPQDAGLVFLTTHGYRFTRVLDRGHGQPVGLLDGVSASFHRVVLRLGIARRGVGFYSLRHTHRTIADTTQDQPAANLIMGHTDTSIANRYRERIGDDRLERVADVIRIWLWPKPKIYEPRRMKAE